MAARNRNMEARIKHITSLKTEMANNDADTRTEAQKALGIRPNAEDKKGEPEAELDKKNAKSEEEDDLEVESLEPHEESGDDEEESEEESKPDDEEESDDESEESEDTVPLTRLLAEKKKTKELEARITGLEKKYGEDAEKELVSQMATELKITAEQAEKLLEFSSKSVLSKLEREGRILTPELKKKLDAFGEGREELDEAEQQRNAEKAEVNHYQSEWTDFLPSLKKQYKNATPAMLKEAAQEMYKLARSKTYGNVPGQHPAYPLDYVYFKEKKTFDTLLRVAPKGRSGEPGHDIDAGDEDEKPDFLSPNMSPQELAKVKAHDQAQKLARDRQNGGIRFQ